MFARIAFNTVLDQRLLGEPALTGKGSIHRQLAQIDHPVSHFSISSGAGSLALNVQGAVACKDASDYSDLARAASFAAASLIRETCTTLSLRPAVVPQAFPGGALHRGQTKLIGLIPSGSTLIFVIALRRPRQILWHCLPPFRCPHRTPV